MEKTFNFNDAMELARRGNLMARVSWDINDGVIFWRPEDTLPASVMPNIKSIPNSLKSYIDTSAHSEFMFTGYLSRYTAGVISNGWVPTEEDAKADDWYVVLPES